MGERIQSIQKGSAPGRGRLGESTDRGGGRAEPRWERGLKQGLECLGRTESDLKTVRKGALWKVAVARHLRERYLIPNPWLSERLNMGTANSLSRLVSRHKSSDADTDKSWKLLENQKYVD